MDVHTARLVYGEFLCAQDDLVISSELHLLYLISPVEGFASGSSWPRGMHDIRVLVLWSRRDHERLASVCFVVSTLVTDLSHAPHHTVKVDPYLFIQAVCRVNYFQCVYWNGYLHSN